MFGIDHDWRLSVTEHDEAVYLNRATGDLIEGRTVQPGEIEYLALNNGFISDLFVNSA